MLYCNDQHSTVLCTPKIAAQVLSGGEREAGRGQNEERSGGEGSVDRERREDEGREREIRRHDDLLASGVLMGICERH